MANFDHRTVGEDWVSFYVFDDLRWQQRPQHSAEPRTGPNIYRYDTLVEAVSKFKELPTHMRTAIGVHLNAASELDIVHRFGEESVLVTDYMNLPAWRHNDAVNRVVGHICEILNIEWQLDRHLLGATVAIPSARFSGFIIPDSYMSDKELVPREPERYGAKIDPYTAINEVFCEEGGGWIPLREAQAQGISFENPHLLKVSRFNVCCKTRPTDKMSRAWDDGLHHMDMSPLDLRILQEGYALRHGNQQDNPIKDIDSPSLIRPWTSLSAIFTSSPEKLTPMNIRTRALTMSCRSVRPAPNSAEEIPGPSRHIWKIFCQTATPKRRLPSWWRRLVFWPV